MKTIAIDIRLIGRNRTGDEAVFLNLTRELLALDRENQYLLVTDRKEPAFLSELGRMLGIAENGHAKIVSLQGKNRFVWNLISIPLFLMWKEPDIFHTQYILPAFVPARTRIVAHIHDVSFRAFPELIGFSDRLFLSMFIPRTMRRADLLVAPSEFTRKEIESRYGIPEDHVAVVPNAIPSSFGHGLTEATCEAVRRKYDLPEKFLLSVGTMQPRKNLPLFLRAFASVRDRLPGMRVVLVGNRKARHHDTDIDRVIAEEKLEHDVIFPGFVDAADLPAIYRLAHGLVFPSRYEGFGIPLLEAFASGVPVAASDIPPFREVGADAALYFHPGRVAECAEVLYTLSTDESRRESCRKAGSKRASEYSWGKSARILFSRYEELLRQQH